MTRIALTIAIAAAALLPATSASAANCGRVPDSIAQQLPAPARAVYWRFCGP